MRRFVFALCALTISIAAFAQIPFEVKAPEWSKVAVPIPEEGVNIRKFPSTSAPRPLVDEDKIDDYHVPLIYYAVWSTATPKKNVYALMFTQSAPIIKEQNGWYQVAGIGPKGEPGWVSAKFCKAVSPEPITIESLKEDPDHYYIISQDGTDYVFCMETNEMDMDVTFSLGRIVDGILVFPYSLYAGYEEGTATKLEKNNYGGYIYKYTSQTMDEYRVPILKRVPKSVIESIIANMTKNTLPVQVYKYNGYFSQL